MQTLTFSGTVFSGTGQGKKFITLPWVQQQIIKKAGFNPYPGTLNIRLTKKSTETKPKLNKLNGAIINPAEGYFIGVLYEAKISGECCFVVLPQMSNYPTDVLELVAPCNLRDKLKLHDGDLVTVQVTG
jgi:riboflavin kinase, archaea type